MERNKRELEQTILRRDTEIQQMMTSLDDDDDDEDISYSKARLNHPFHICTPFLGLRQHLKMVSCMILPEGINSKSYSQKTYACFH